MKTALYARISDDEGEIENQVAVLNQWAAAKGYDVVDTYLDTGSAWQHSDQRELRRLLVDCDRGKVRLVLVYDLSRLTRKGPLDMMLTLKAFADKGAQIHSYLDSWLNVPNEWNDILIPLFGKFAEVYSRQLSERVKAGMQRAKAQGKHVGRPRKKAVAKC